MAWTYSDWITKEVGSSERLTRFRLHIQEVSDKVSTPDFTHQGSSIDREHLQKYLDSLLKLENEESTKPTTGANSSPVFTKGRAIVR